MNRKDEIRNAYKEVGTAHSFYDRMMTGQGLPGKIVLKGVWQMTNEDAMEYQTRAMEPIPSDFSGKLLEVPVGTGVLSMPVFQSLKEADITCLDYSEKMMETAEKRAAEMGIHNIAFVQGDVGKLPFEDESFDIVLSLNGFHAFPDKEAAYRETYRVLKKGGIFTGCFYIEKGNRHTDSWINAVYVRRGYFTPPFETEQSLARRLSNMYETAEVSTVKSIACFRCVK